MTLRFITAGESHGPALTGLIEGIPSGLALSADEVNADLGRRQGGYGRGGRMKIESDAAEFLSGVRWGKTIGSPITVRITNRDWDNWRDGMSPDAAKDGSIKPVTRPRPGHADLAGALKYGHTDVRNILERSSARETAMRVALGAIARKFLAELGVTLGSFVVSIGQAQMSGAAVEGKGLWALASDAEASPVRCPDTAASDAMRTEIDRAIKDGDSLGGAFVVFAEGLPVGLGSHVQWDRRLDGRIAQAMMSIQAIKGVEIGIGFEAAQRRGSEVMDEIIPAKDASFTRATNNAGGIEGGMTNGMPITLRAAMKPIPTLKKPLRSVDLVTGDVVEAAYERSDTCAVPAAAVIGEAMLALTLAAAMLEKFGGDSIGETRRNLDSYNASLGR